MYTERLSGGLLCSVKVYSKLPGCERILYLLKNLALAGYVMPSMPCMSIPSCLVSWKP